MKPPQTLYCVADEAGFRLLRGSGPDLKPLIDRRADDFDDVGHEFGQKGRNHTGRGQRIRFGHVTTSQAELERPRLARHVAAALKDAWDQGWADQIVIAAGPKMLGALRDALPANLAAHIVAEFPKDLSDVPVHDLLSHLAHPK